MEPSSFFFFFLSKYILSICYVAGRNYIEVGDVSQGYIEMFLLIISLKLIFYSIYKSFLFIDLYKTKDFVPSMEEFHYALVYFRNVSFVKNL